MTAPTFWATVEHVRPTFSPRCQPSTRCWRRGLARSLTRGACASSSAEPRQLIGEFEERFGVPIVEGYGLSECTVVCPARPSRAGAENLMVAGGGRLRGEGGGHFGPGPV